MTRVVKNAGQRAAAAPTAERVVASRVGRYRFNLIACGIVAALIWAVYGRSLSSPFVFDDYDSVVQNPSITTLWPLTGHDGQPGALTPPNHSPVAGRPLVNLSFAVNYALSDLNPTGYRALNIAIHVVAAMLLFLIARRVLRFPSFGDRLNRASGMLALGASMLWAVHPLQTEAVVYVSQRTELLVALCYLATVYSCLRYWSAAAPAERRRWLIFAALANLAGMASKEVMVTAPVTALLLDRALRAKSFRHALRDSWPLYAALAAGWVLLVDLNIGNPRGASAGFGEGVPASVWWFTQARAVFLYLKLAVWPNPLSLHYAPDYVRSAVAALPWLVGASLLAIASAWLLWRRHPVGLAGAWMFVILAPTLVVPIPTEVIAERRMYLPLGGLLLMAVAGAYWLISELGFEVKRPERRRGTPVRRGVSVATTAFGALLLGSSLASERRIRDFRDELTLWQSAVAAQPDDPVALYNLGVANLNANQVGGAIEYLTASIARDPAYSAARINLAVALARAGRAQEAIPQLDKALQLTPDDADALADYGMVLSQLGRAGEAAERFERAHELAPGNLVILTKLLDAEVAAGDATKAIKTGEQTLALAQSLGQHQVADRVQRWLAASAASSERAGQAGDCTHTGARGARGASPSVAPARTACEKPGAPRLQSHNSAVGSTR